MAPVLTLILIPSCDHLAAQDPSVLDAWTPKPLNTENVLCDGVACGYAFILNLKPCPERPDIARPNGFGPIVSGVGL